MNGENVLIPSTAGNLAGGTSLARVTSVTSDGVATIQFSDIVDRSFSLGEFFQAWGISFDRGHLGRMQSRADAPLTMSVNGADNSQFDQYTIAGEESVVVTSG